MTIAYIDCIAGVSGDMLLGALVDSGLPIRTLTDRLNALHLADFNLNVSKVSKNGIAATKIDVQVKDEVTERHLPDIITIVENSQLASQIKSKAITIFQRLGAVEAAIHSTTLEDVHLHELGGVDTIVDVVGVLLGFEALGVDQIHASPLPLGRGFTRSAHGKLPLPAPATVRLLEGVPIVGSDIARELVTPTGAALLVHLVDCWGQIPAMTLTASGYGAGGWDLEIPNVVRLLLGESSAKGVEQVETLAVLETNIDDMNPEFYNHIMESLLACGAFDVSLTAIHMKKNRPATMLTVLAPLHLATELRQAIFRETTTLGIRQYSVQRYKLQRRMETVETLYGPIKVKVVQFAPGQERFAPEYEDCRQAALTHGVPLQRVYQAALVLGAEMQR